MSTAGHRGWPARSTAYEREIIAMMGNVTAQKVTDALIDAAQMVEVPILQDKSWTSAEVAALLRRLASDIAVTAEQAFRTTLGDDPWTP